MLTDIVHRHRQEFQHFRNRSYCPRTKERELIQALGSALIKIVVGPRRAGKSRLIQKVLENERTAYLNFEEEQFKNFSGDDIVEAANQVYGDVKYWYLDEVQDFPDWEILLNKLHRRGYNLIVTGSNAKLLSSELATALTGRHIPIELLPFSYQEYLNALGAERSLDSFSTYLEKGGFPDVIFEPSLDHRNYLKTLSDSIILKDLVGRKKIRHPLDLTNTFSLLVNNTTARTSARALSAALRRKPSSTTVDKYLKYFEEAYLVESTKAFSYKTKERIQSERKPYLIDTGLIGALSSPTLPIQSKQLENAVYLALRRNGLVQASSIFHYRLEGGREIDFLVRDGHKTTQLIQVCLDMSALETRKRELEALAQAHQEFNEAELLIVTSSEFGTEKIGMNNKNIRILPGYQFC